ncbi:putative glycosyl transferase, group 1 [Stanieria sp. NIES-3757]|nr:putative glycosyl transferase, group 1 [Stanieria sp. NIES-3757]
MSKYYIIYSHQISLQPNTAHEIHDVQCADAAANLGYPTVLVYPNQQQHNFNLFNFLFPFRPQIPSKEIVEFYDIQSNLETAPLPLPGQFLPLPDKLTHPSTIICKYYFPLHIFSKTKVLHTRDWNCAKAAVQNKIPTIYESHYFQSKPLETKIVNSPYFRIAVTQSELTRQSLIQAGVPEQKAIWLHNGFGQSFLTRQPAEAKAWRQQLLSENYQYLVVYSGALYRFKGIDLLIDVARLLPHIQFAITGGTDSQIQDYRQLAQEKQVNNINFLGWILPRSRLVSLLQAADLLAHPHLSGKEADFTNPVKFFQYIASGTPMVVTEIPPLLPFKSSPLVATWCPPDDPGAFAQAIGQSLRNYPYQSEGYQTNIDFASQFTWENRTTKIMSYVD